jgi:uncharacterized membrane protein HdeD (DUF308 family)
MSEARFTRSDWYSTVTSLVTVVLGIVILVRTWGYGPHLTPWLVGGGFVALGAYRLSFVVGYLRRRRST